MIIYNDVMMIAMVQLAHTYTPNPGYQARARHCGAQLDAVAPLTMLSDYSRTKSAKKVPYHL